MTARLKGRATVMPDRLFVPDPVASIHLQIANFRVAEIGAGLCASDAQSITRAVLAEQGGMDLTPQRYPGMFDELSVYVRGAERADPQRLLSKSLLEWETVEHAERRGIADGLADADAFLDLLRYVHRSVKGGATAFRNGPVFIRPDADGNVIEFPPWQLCEPLLRALAAFTARHIERYPALCAMVGYAGVIHAHPFRDGNGRTARILFNLILRHGCQSRHFLPLSRLTTLSEGGFLIKLRRALYGGEWEPLAAFFVDALRLSHEIQGRNSGRNTSQTDWEFQNARSQFS